MRDIGDGDEQPPCAAFLRGADGIVEIPGVLPVDGHEELPAQIFQSGKGNMGGCPFCFIHDIVGEGFGDGKVELGQPLLDGGIAFLAEGSGGAA